MSCFVKSNESLDELHVIEPLGSGGIYQHAVAFSNYLSENGFSIVLHTTHDYEETESVKFRVCGCFRNFHQESWILRNTMRFSSFCLRTAPHLWVSSYGRYINLQGNAHPLLTLLIGMILRIRSHGIVYTPHNLFERNRQWSGKLVRKCIIKCSRLVIVFNKVDQRLLSKESVPTVRLPLLMPHVEPNDNLIEKLKRNLQDEHLKVFLFAGQMREDKGILDLLEIANLLRNYGILLVVGKAIDQMGYETIKRLEKEPNCRVYEGFYALSDFLAFFEIADCLLLPYHIVSQSGTVAYARRVNLPTIGYAHENWEDDLSSVTFHSPKALVDEAKRVLTHETQYNSKEQVDFMKFKETLMHSLEKK